MCQVCADFVGYVSHFICGCSWPKTLGYMTILVKIAALNSENQRDESCYRLWIRHLEMLVDLHRSETIIEKTFIFESILYTYFEYRKSNRVLIG